MKVYSDSSAVPVESLCVDVEGGIWDEELVSFPKVKGKPQALDKEVQRRNKYFLMQKAHAYPVAAVQLRQWAFGTDD